MSTANDKGHPSKDGTSEGINSPRTTTSGRDSKMEAFRRTIEAISIRTGKSERRPEE